MALTLDVYMPVSWQAEIYNLKRGLFTCYHGEAVQSLGTATSATPTLLFLLSRHLRNYGKFIKFVKVWH